MLLMIIGLLIRRSSENMKKNLISYNINHKNKINNDKVFEIPLIQCPPKRTHRSKPRRKYSISNLHPRKILTERRHKSRISKKYNKSYKTYNKLKKEYEIIIHPTKNNLAKSFSERRFSNVSRPKTRSLNRDKAKII
mmetsp:Transcript_18690/g.16553  ORF Transcript_18690/g.16553 Transcript_18690/m.16553 type:complete len:137 (+) Transcript_18690:300-710(+)